MKITTNNQPRPILFWSDLTDKEQRDFDWLETEEDQAFAHFFRYKGQVYCLDEFVNTHQFGPFSGWHGLQATSAFSGVLVKINHGNSDEVIVGYCYS